MITSFFIAFTSPLGLFITLVFLQLFTIFGSIHFSARGLLYIKKGLASENLKIISKGTSNLALAIALFTGFFISLSKFK